MSAAAASPAPLPPLPLSKEERQRQREEEKLRQKDERQRQKRLAEVESSIGIEEERLADIEALLADPALFSDHEAARQRGEEHAAVTARIATLYEEWERLQG